MHPSNPSSPEKSDPPSALDWAQRAHRTEDVLTALTLRTARRRRRRRQWVATAVVACGVFLAGVTYWWTPSAASTAIAAATIVIDGPPQQVLSDGSKIDLKDQVSFSVDYAPDVRRIRLHKGTAYFQVKKDPRRPFIVEVDGLQVRAVGTAFSVQSNATGVQVFVTEGRVEVAAGATQATHTIPPPALVDAGQRVAVPSLDSGSPRSAFVVESLPTQQLKEQIAWRAPRLKFTGTPLAEAVVMFNQHNHRQLVIADPSLQDAQISGILRADNVNSLLELLRVHFNVRARLDDPDKIMLERSPEGH
ncbi:MAG TPA: FecR domain-containing protein [Opitutaceae bacterium]|nr:FecR domain-containing protein [Opitutaceae bacterium]